MTAAPDSTPLVLVYAGGSVFGRLLASDLLAATTARLLLVGPNGGPEREAARDLDPSGERVTAAQAPLDDAAPLRALLAGVSAAVLCVRGFRDLPLTLLDACLAEGVAYFDIADNRGYMHRVLARRPAIDAAGVTVGAGLGILPGLSALLVEHGVRELELYEVARVDVAVYIGSHRARGVGALTAALRCAGKALARGVYGWSGRQRAMFPPPIGKRKVYNFDAPDYDLFPGLFHMPQDRTRVRMGFELDIVNRTLAILGLLRRMGWRWRYRGPLISILLALSAPLRAVGEDDGGVLATVRGIGSRSGRHAVIRAGTQSIVAPDARLLTTAPCAVAVARYLDGQMAGGLVEWRAWIAPGEMWDALRARGMVVEWRRE